MFVIATPRGSTIYKNLVSIPIQLYIRNTLSAVVSPEESPGHPTSDFLSIYPIFVFLISFFFFISSKPQSGQISESHAITFSNSQISDSWLLLDTFSRKLGNGHLSFMHLYTRQSYTAVSILVNLILKGQRQHFVKVETELVSSRQQRILWYNDSSSQKSWGCLNDSIPSMYNWDHKFLEKKNASYPYFWSQLVMYLSTFNLMKDTTGQHTECSSDPTSHKWQSWNLYSGFIAPDSTFSTCIWIYIVSKRFHFAKQ